jgi:O-antigen/teichoic acid export membrane protein
VMQMIGPQLPFFSRSLAAGEPAAAADRMKRTLVLIHAGAALAAVGFYLVSPPLVLFWLGPGRYVDDVTLFFLAVDLFIGISSTAWAQFVLASGRNRFAYSTLGAGILNITAVVLLAPMLGICAVPLATLTAGALTNYTLGPLLGYQLLKRLRDNEPLKGCAPA